MQMNGASEFRPPRRRVDFRRRFRRLPRRVGWIDRLSTTSETLPARYALLTATREALRLQPACLNDDADFHYRKYCVSPAKTETEQFSILSHSAYASLSMISALPHYAAAFQHSCPRLKKCESLQFLSHRELMII
jgi:hypothetical protein